MPTVTLPNQMAIGIGLVGIFDNHMANWELSGWEKVRVEKSWGKER